MSRRFRRWSIVAFLVLVPIAIHAAWDAIEVRAARAAIDAVAATGAPINVDELVRSTASTEMAPPTEIPPAQDAAPYYTAAAALVRSSVFGPYNVLVRSIRSESDLIPVLGKARDELASQSEALRILDRATALEFRRFAPGMDYGYRGSQLNALANLVMLRTMYAGATKDADGAAASLLAELRLYGTNTTPIPMDWWHRSQTLPDRLALALNKAPMSEASLARLAAELARHDEDDRLTMEIMSQRATLIDSFVQNSGYRYQGPGVVGAFLPRGGRFETALARPFYARWMRQELSVFGELLDASKRPWPERIDAIQAVQAGSHLPGYASPGAYYFQRAVVSSTTGSLVTDLAAIRAARIAVALERFKLIHHGQLPDQLEELVPRGGFFDRVPIDPYSGKPMIYRVIDGGYTVYSVGENRTDDGGDLVDTRVRDERTAQTIGHPSRDMGLRVVRVPK